MIIEGGGERALANSTNKHRKYMIYNKKFYVRVPASRSSGGFVSQSEKRSSSNVTCRFPRSPCEGTENKQLYKNRK